MPQTRPFLGDKPHIYLIDVTNRDGVQACGVYMSYFERTIINLYLSKMGIVQSEFGFPTIARERSYLETNIALEAQGAFAPMQLSGWIRAMASDVEKAREIQELEHINLSISTSQVMINGKFQGRMDEAKIIAQMAEAVRTARAFGFKSIGVNAEDASRTRHYLDQSYLQDFALAAKEAGADRFRYCDTLGFDRPYTTYDRVQRLAGAVQLPIELHCHNDTGYAVANSVEGAMGAISAGVDAYINTTINGYGERAGNADLVSVILAMRFSSGLQGKELLDTRINLGMAWQICTYASEATKIPIPHNQPGVGDNAFSHESGIHADGMLKDRSNYELFSPEELGIPSSVELETGRRIGVGSYGGRKGLEHVLTKNNIETDDVDTLLSLVCVAATQSKRGLNPDEIRVLAASPPDLMRKMLTQTPA